jgi:glycosylphosphatidylinositol phospholipase D
VCSFGLALAGLGRASDAQGQTRSLFAIGAGDLQTTSTRIGKVFVYRITGDRPNVTVELVSTISGGADDYHFGTALCGLGDVNGDGIPDLGVGSHRRGQTPTVAGRGYLILGGARFGGAGAQESVAGHASTTDGIVRMGDMISSDTFGTDCEGMGDVNHDGYADFAIAAPGGLRVYMFLGRSDFDARPSMSPPDVVHLSNAAWTQPGELSSADVDGDGLPDLIVGDTNAVYVLPGNLTAGVSATPMVVFSQSTTVATGFPVVGLQSLRDAASGEASFNDLAIGKVGSSVTVRY